MKLGYQLTKDVYVHSIIYSLGFPEKEAEDIFNQFYYEKKLDDLKEIIQQKERELTNDE